MVEGLHMSGSLFLRTLRGATLFAAGMLVAGTSISVAAPVRPAATQTRVSSCSGLNFHPIDSRTVYRWAGRMLWRAGQGGDGWFLCDANLPNKAVVTRVRFTVKDGHDLQSLQYCALVRASLASASATPQALGVVSPTGMAAEPGTVRKSDTSISHATIDNSTYSYWLQCQILWDDRLIAPGDAYAAIVGADVTYTISSTNG
jgi:hypothetical protein